MGSLVWTVVKNGVIGCKICFKKGVIMQADDFGRHTDMGVPPPLATPLGHRCADQDFLSSLCLLQNLCFFFYFQWMFGIGKNKGSIETEAPGFRP